jgi:hypothetical protein
MLRPLVIIALGLTVRRSHLERPARNLEHLKLHAVEILSEILGDQLAAIDLFALIVERRCLKWFSDGRVRQTVSKAWALVDTDDHAY